MNILLWNFTIMYDLSFFLICLCKKLNVNLQVNLNKDLLIKNSSILL